MVGVCLVGCGWFTCRGHIPALKKLTKKELSEVRIVAVCARSESSRRRALTRLGTQDVAQYSSIDDALCDERIRIALIALPRSANSRIIVKCFEKGLDVISEKPTGWSAAEISLCWNAAVKYRSKWRVLENWAFKPGIHFFADLVDDDRPLNYVMSTPLTQVVVSADEKDWRASECTEVQRQIDVAVHFVRALRIWFGEIISSRQEENCWRFQHESGSSGTLRFIASTDSGTQIECKPHFQDEPLLWYDITKKEVLYQGDRLKPPTQGDNWIDGGVRLALGEAFGAILGKVHAQSTSAEESIRDLIALNFTSVPRLILGPDCVARPRTQNDIIELSRLFFTKHTLLPIGNGRSWGLAERFLQRKGIVVNMRLMNRIRFESPYIIAQAGATLRSVRDRLLKKNLCLPSWPVYLDATVGGALATASHGSSPRHGTLCDSVFAVQVLCTKRNALRWIARHTNIWPLADELEIDPVHFDAALCCVGRVIVTAVAFAPVSKYYVSRSVSTVKNIEASHLVNLSKETGHVWIHWDLVTENAHILKLTEDGDDRRIYDGTNFFPYPKELIDALPRTSDSSRTYSAEYAIPLSSATQALGAIRLAVSESFDQNLSGGAVVEIKFLKAGSTVPFCAMNYCASSSSSAMIDRVVICFNVYVPAPASPWVSSVEHVLRSLGGVPHFGKGGLLDVDATSILESIPMRARPYLKEGRS